MSSEAIHDELQIHKELEKKHVPTFLSIIEDRRNYVHQLLREYRGALATELRKSGEETTRSNELLLRCCMAELLLSGRKMRTTLGAYFVFVKARCGYVPHQFGSTFKDFFEDCFLVGIPETVQQFAVGEDGHQALLDKHQFHNPLA